jgi:hypothetical protein
MPRSVADAVHGCVVAEWCVEAVVIVGVEEPVEARERAWPDRSVRPYGRRLTDMAGQPERTDMPPSMTISVPVTQRDSSEAR